MTAPAITPATFPYRRKWTKAEIDEIMARYEKLRYAMTDPVGPTGQVLFLPPDMIAILALHLSLAGADIQDADAYIWGRQRTDANAMFQDSVDWLLKKEHAPTDQPDATEAAARAAAARIKQQLPREVRDALAVILADEYKKDMAKTDPTDVEKAENKLRENKLRDLNAEGR